MTKSLMPLFQEILTTIGENPSREGLLDTPKRAAKALEFMTQGYHQSLDDIINHALFESTAEEMVVIKNIELYSLCEHHLLPFYGHCHIGYLPQGKILGLSKFARIVDFFARRLQVQENLTQQIAKCIANITGASGVAVLIEAKHLCMMMRGVEKQNSLMTTSMMLGAFKEQPATRAEFLTLVNSK